MRWMMTMESCEVQKIIDEAKKYVWKTCLYGAGRLGLNFGNEIFALLQLKMDYVTDADKNAIGQYDVDLTKKVSVDELCNFQNDVLVIVCVGIKYHEEIRNTLRINKKLHVVYLHDLIKLDCVVENFYNVEKIEQEQKKIAVFTCITGNYDEVLEPLYKPDSCDFYLISDVKPDSETAFRFIHVDDVAPKGLNNKDKNRYCKMHGFDIFPEYDYSIYVDGSIRIIGDISSYTKDVGFCGLAMLKNPYHDCIFEEGIKMVASGKADSKRTIELLRHYINDGMPRNYGMFECGVVVSKTDNELGCNILEQWYEEYMKHQLRDQFSLPYVLWKNGLPLGTIGLCDSGRNVRNSDIAVRQKRH